MHNPTIEVVLSRAADIRTALLREPDDRVSCESRFGSYTLKGDFTEILGLVLEHYPHEAQRVLVAAGYRIVAAHGDATFAAKTTDAVCPACGELIAETYVVGDAVPSYHCGGAGKLRCPLAEAVLNLASDAAFEGDYATQLAVVMTAYVDGGQYAVRLVCEGENDIGDEPAAVFVDGTLAGYVDDLKVVNYAEVERIIRQRPGASR